MTNDSDPDGDVISLVSVNTEGSLGSVLDINADGTVTYTPPSFWCGIDTFTYTITDGALESTATVTVNVLD